MSSRRIPLIFLLPFLFSFFVIPTTTHADAASDLQAQIDANSQQIDALKAEIAAYQKQLDAIGTQKSTLQSAISALTISQKQLATQIQVTQNNIALANLQIKQLTLSIGSKEASISSDQDVISKQLRSIMDNEQTPLVATLMSSDSFSSAWQSVDQAIQFNRSLAASIEDLKQARQQLSDNRTQVATKKSQLVSLQAQLTIQKRSVDASKASQQQLLAQTKNKEANYQKLIAQKQAAERSFEQELVNLQGQLNLVVHPGLLPKAGTGLLSWPFSDSFMANCAQRKSIFGNLFCVTQYFGNTSFSTANPQIYNGHGHNAIDIAAPIGTPVYAALGGVVMGTGNTDLVRGCYSFGKWIMINHGNGLSTLYAHLSEIDVSQGQQIDSRQLIGLSGMTGYATGPHIHFGVYATEGTKIMTLRQFRGAT
ncbi:MAG TPA: peptidoglycan DD-metalloendopeptidase family protein, partial [Candidatus Paceibacterota bacterium]